MKRLLVTLAVFGHLCSCGSEAPEEQCEDPPVYAAEVVAYQLGEGGGFGESALPAIVLGPPEYGPPESGSLDVVSLGVGGFIDLGFGEFEIVDGVGPDFVVWENVFWAGGNPEAPFVEMGEVSVSEDGKTWRTFSCIPNMAEDFDSGCAGWRPRQDYDPCDATSELGGDPFDLAELGVSRARYVRIKDLSKAGEAPSAGFDLDAVGILNSQALTP